MSRIADYETIQSLGGGSHGQVWLCGPPARLGLAADTVALKIFERATDADEYARVVEEVRVYAAAGSEQLVPVYDVGRHGERLYYSMEYFPRGRAVERVGPLGLRDRARGRRCRPRCARAARGGDRPPRDQARQHHADRARRQARRPGPAARRVAGPDRHRRRHLVGGDHGARHRPRREGGARLRHLVPGRVAAPGARRARPCSASSPTPASSRCCAT